MKRAKRLKRKNRNNRRKTIYNVTTLSFKESVMKIAQDRSDEISKAVVARINFEYDLVAAEAK